MAKKGLAPVSSETRSASGRGIQVALEGVADEGEEILSGQRAERQLGNARAVLPSAFDGREHRVIGSPPRGAIAPMVKSRPTERWAAGPDQSEACRIGPTAHRRTEPTCSTTTLSADSAYVGSSTDYHHAQVRVSDPDYGWR